MLQAHYTLTIAYKVAIATGLSKEAAKLYAAAVQNGNGTDINHLKVIQ